MRISVIIPFYNAREYLRECLDSVVSQTLAEIEVVCVDDGSTDGSAALVEAMAAHHDGIRLFRQTNGGPGSARNVGIREARGEYLFFLDADDRIPDDRALEELFLRAEGMNAEMVLSSARQMTVDGMDCGRMPWVLRSDIVAGREMIAPKDLGDAMFFLAGAVPWAKLFRRAFLVREGLSFPELRRAEDFPFVQLAIAMSSSLAILDRDVICHRIRVDGSLEALKDHHPREFGAGERILWHEIARRNLGPTVERAARARAIMRISYNLMTMHSFYGYSAAFDEAKKVGELLDLLTFRPKVAGISSVCERVADVLSSSSAGDSLLVQLKKRVASVPNAETQDLESLVLAIRRVAAERDAAVREVCALKSSASYRLGLFVSWPLRMAYSWWRRK